MLSDGAEHMNVTKMEKIQLLVFTDFERPFDKLKVSQLFIRDSLTNENASINFFDFHGFLFVYSALNFDQHFQRYWEGAEKMIRFEPDDLDLALCCALVVTQHDRNGLQQVKSYASEKDTKVRFRIHQK